MVSIVIGVMCAFCYLFGVWVGRNKLKSNADQRIQDVESVEPMQASDIVVRSNLEPFRVADTPQTDRMTEEEIDTMLAKALVGQTDCSWMRYEE